MERMEEKKKSGGMEYAARTLSAFWGAWRPNALVISAALVILASMILNRVDVIEANEAMWMSLGAVLAYLGGALNSLFAPPGPEAGVPQAIVTEDSGQVPRLQAEKLN